MIEQVVIAAVVILWPLWLYLILRFALGGKR